MEATGSSSRLRQANAVPLEKLEVLHVNIVGCGAIGSFAALALAKLGVRSLYLFDGDRVETHNIGCQLYGQEDVGLYKTQALHDIVADRTDGVLPFRVNLVGVDRGTNLTHQRAQTITVVATDSLESRKEVFVAWLRSFYKDTQQHLLIDARMGLAVLHMFNVTNDALDNLAVYADTLKGRPVDASCSARGIVYCPMIAAGMIAHAVKCYACESGWPHEIVFYIPTGAVTRIFYDRSPPPPIDQTLRQLIQSKTLIPENLT